MAHLSGSLAHGVRLLDQFRHTEPTPQKMAEFERALSTLLREVGRRILAWVLIIWSPRTPQRRRLACDLRDDSIGDEGNSATRGQHFLAR